MTRLKTALILSAALLASCGNNQTEDRTVVTQNSTTTVETVINGDTVLSLTLSDGYIMAPLKGRDVAAGYFVAENSGDAVAIVSASSPIAETVELHTHTMDGGVMKMREVERVDLAAGETVTFKPGGLHLMMFGFAREEGQTETPVTLTFENGDTLDVTFPIRERG